MSYAQTLLFTNNASTVLAAPAGSGATTITLPAGKGALFPNPAAGQAFVATLNDAATSLITEIVLCTARTADTLTIVRAQEGTTALGWNAGDIFSSFPTAGTMASLVQQYQFQQQLPNYAQDIGAADIIVALIDPAPASLLNLIGAPLRIHMAHTNTSNVVNIYINALAPARVKNTDGTDPAIGSLVAGGMYVFIFDGTNFQLVSGGTVSANTSSGATASGYIRHPNGMIIQWGKFFSATGNGDVVTLPIPFNTVYTLAVDVGTGSSAEKNLINTNTGSLTQFSVWTWTFTAGNWVTASGKGVGWVAIGY